MKPHTLIKGEIHLNEIYYLEIRDVSRGVLLFVDRYGIPNSYPKLVKNQIYLNQPYKMNTMSNIIYKYIIITFSIVNNKFLYEGRDSGSGTSRPSTCSEIVHCQGYLPGNPLLYHSLMHQKPFLTSLLPDSCRSP